MKNYTIKDIARLAGVGSSTVSRTINNYPGVNAETRERILEIIEKYNYTPNSNAKSLKQLNSQIICIIVKGILNPFFSGIIIEMQTNIEREGFVPVVSYIDEQDDEIAYAKQLLSEKKGVGIIFLGGSAVNKEEELAKFNKPCVFATSSARECKVQRISSVSIDDRLGAKTAINYLMESGHKEILTIGGEIKQQDLIFHRYEGIRDAYKDKGQDFNEREMYVQSKFSYESAYKAIEKYMKCKRKFTAIFAMSDIMAIGAAKYITDIGMKIPDDISIIGFDGIEIAEFYTPTVATIRQPYIEIAQKSVELLIKSIDDESFFEHLLLRGELLKGNSVKLI